MHDYSSFGLCNGKQKEKQIDKMDIQLLECASFEQQTCTGAHMPVLLL